MLRFLAPLLIAAPLCLGGGLAHAQSGPLPAPLDPTFGAPAKPPPPAKGPHKKAAAARSAGSDADEAEKAARLAEGRKKFFEQSMGFDNGKSGPVTLSNDNGGPPALGLKF